MPDMRSCMTLLISTVAFMIPLILMIAGGYFLFMAMTGD